MNTGSGTLSRHVRAPSSDSTISSDSTLTMLSRSPSPPSFAGDIENNRINISSASPTWSPSPGEWQPTQPSYPVPNFRPETEMRNIRNSYLTDRMVAVQENATLAHHVAQLFPLASIDELNRLSVTDVANQLSQDRLRPHLPRTTAFATPIAQHQPQIGNNNGSDRWSDQTNSSMSLSVRPAVIPSIEGQSEFSGSSTQTTRTTPSDGYGIQMLLDANEVISGRSTSELASRYRVDLNTLRAYGPRDASQATAGTADSEATMHCR